MALTRLLPRPSSRARSDRGPTLARVIAFANQKGGVAKTTTTLNLGVALAEKGMRVLCIDLDPQGNLTMSQGLNPDTIERSMFDVLVHRLPIREVIATREIDIAVASIDLAGADMALASQIGRARAPEGARAGQERLRLHPDGHAALARPADDQRVRRRHRGDRPRPDRVPLAARPRPAREHAADGAREPEPARLDHGDRPDDVRPPDHALARGGRDPARELRRARLQHEDPQDDPLRRGTRPGLLDHRLRARRRGRRHVP